MGKEVFIFAKCSPDKPTALQWKALHTRIFTQYKLVLIKKKNKTAQKWYKVAREGAYLGITGGEEGAHVGKGRKGISWIAGVEHIWT